MKRTDTFTNKLELVGFGLEKDFIHMLWGNLFILMITWATVFKSAIPWGECPEFYYVITELLPKRKES